MAITSVLQSVTSISDCHISVIEFDAKVAEDKLQYSSWLLAVATAGFAIAVTQGDKVLEHSNFPPEIGNVLLGAATLMFATSAALGAVVKRLINMVLESFRQRMSLILRQKVAIEADVSVVKVPCNQSIDDLVTAVASVSYLPQAKQVLWQKFSKAGDKADANYKRALIGQQVSGGIGYLLVFVASV